jgi:septum formation protein
MSDTFSPSLILASASPRRRELLRSIGLDFRIIPAHVDENYLAGESPGQHVRRLSTIKAMAVAQKYQKAWVLGADTIVVIDETILGKPKNRTQAKNMLKKLSGREHKVFTGVTIIHRTLNIHEIKVIQSTVRFKTISTEEMNWYTACDEPYDKAGGYAVQGKGAIFIKSIRGSYSNVIGLPLCEVVELLKKYDAINLD